MTAQEFKETYPEMAHLKGEDLIDAMTDAMLHQQAGEEIIKTILPFWNRYQLRWLFYRKYNSSLFRPAWQSDKVCKNCGHGADSMMMFGRQIFCLKCGSELIKVPNTHLKYRLWKLWKRVDKKLEYSLDYLHILRKRNESRFGVFGDESSY